MDARRHQREASPPESSTPSLTSDGLTASSSSVRTRAALGDYGGPLVTLRSASPLHSRSSSSPSPTHSRGAHLVEGPTPTKLKRTSMASAASSGSASTAVGGGADISRRADEIVREAQESARRKLASQSVRLHQAVDSD